MIRSKAPEISPQQVTLLDLNLEDKLHLPIVWLIANILGIIWSCRAEKKTITLFNTRATLEANIMLLRKTRFIGAAESVHLMLKK